MKKTILIVNPTNLNLIKAIYNVLTTNLLEIIIIGNRNIINNLCIQIHLNIDLLQLIEYTDENDIYQKIITCQKNHCVSGIIIDEFINRPLIKNDCHYICTMIDFNIFKQSVFIINNNKPMELINNIKETMIILRKLQINTINIGLIAISKDKALQRRKQIKNELGVKKVDIITENKIKKSKYNIIIFEEKYKEIEYIKQIHQMVLPRIIEIKMASNIYIFDAHQQSFKNLVLQLIFLNKINLLDYKLNSQVI